MTGLAVVVASGACLAGCSTSGGTGAEPSTLLAQASTAVSSEHAVHVSGSITSTKGSQVDSVVVDATGNQAGASAGTLRFAGRGMGFDGETRFVIEGGSTFFFGDTALWTSLFGKSSTSAEAEALMPKVVDHWIELPASSTALIDTDALGLPVPTLWLEKSLKLKGKLHNQGSATLSGRRGIEVTSSQGAALIVAATPPTLPLALSAETTKSGDLVRLSLVISYPSSASISKPKSYQSLSKIESVYLNGS